MHNSIPFLSYPHMYIIITSDVIVVIYIVQLSHYSGNLDTLGTKIFVLTSEVSLFHRGVGRCF